MKNLFLLILPILLFSNGSCENKENSASEESGPFTTEDLIFKEVAKEYDGLEKNDLCIVEVEELKSLFVVGFFAYDKGCSVDKLFYNGYEIKADHSESNKIMTAKDFQNNPEKIVETYHIKVINAFKTTVRETNEDFSDGKFFAPETTVEGDQIISKLWVQRPSGMIKERSYYMSTLTFDSKGNFISLNKTKQFSVAF